ncbi:MAG: hypothetical protein O6952_08855, partial [Planctomycetota bacterium]|nr:hypothetical protein [Planctomycetota bacterium]
MKLDYFGYQGLSPEKKKVPAALIVGKAEYLRSLVRADLLDTILGPTDRRMNLTAADASGSPRIDVTSLLDDLRTPSLLGGPRLVHLSGVEGLAKEDRPRIEEYLAHPATGAHLILEGTTLPANMRLFKAIEKMGFVIQCRPLYETPPPWQRGSGESEVARWILLRVEARGGRIRPSAIDALVEAWGADLASIDGAIEQASLLAGESGQI